MLRNFFLTAWRTLLRHRVNTMINVLGLSLGITICLVIFLLVRHELSYDRFHPDGDRIYRLVTHSSGPDGENDFAFINRPSPDGIRAELSGFQAVAAFDNLFSDVIVPKQGHAPTVFDAAKSGEQSSPIIFAQPQYFDIFKYQWLAGTPATLNDPFKVVLTRSEAERYFGRVDDPRQWLGRRLIYKDSLQTTVSGIIADWRQNSDFAFKDFISRSTIQHSFIAPMMEPDNWGNFDYDAQGLVKLAPGVTAAQIERQFLDFDKRHHVGPPDFKNAYHLQPLSDIHFDTRYFDDFSRQASLPTLYGLAAIAAFILLIAAINFINLSTAQSVRRAREIGVRKVLGGRRGALVIQFLCETLVLVLAATILSLIITNPLLTAFQGLLPRGVRLEVFQWPTAVFLTATVLLTSLLAGFYPARVLSGYTPAVSLKGQAPPSAGGKSGLRKALIVFQFTVSLIFIIGTLVIGRQIHFVLNSDLGFDHDAIVVIRTGQDGPQHHRSALANLIREIPGVQRIARNIEMPTAPGHPGTLLEYKEGGEHKVMASLDMVDTDYIHVFGMHLLAGRNLLPSDTNREILVNLTLTKQLGFRNPADALGHMVSSGQTRGMLPIVGVINDFHSTTMHQPITPFFLTQYEPAGQDISVKLSTKGQTADQLTTILAKMNAAWRSVYPDKKFDYTFFDESIAKLYDSERKTSRIMNIAMGIAIFISCLGLFGLAAFVAEQRTKEIGIRKVLGATVGDIVTMLSKDFVWLVGLAILIASPVAWYFMDRWLQDFVYRVPISWWIYALAGISAIAIALLTVSFQAVRAATANPVDSLRSE